MIYFLTPNAEHLEAREAVEDIAEVAVTRVRDAEHHSGDQDAAGVRGLVVGVCDDVSCVEGGEGGDQTVADHGDGLMLIFSSLYLSISLAISVST
jgi:hypothetical protein